MVAVVTDNVVGFCVQTFRKSLQELDADYLKKAFNAMSEESKVVYQNVVVLIGGRETNFMLHAERPGRECQVEG